MKRTCALVVAFVVLGLASIKAFAGASSPFSVQISDAYSYASGTVAGAHSSSDSNQFIQCSLNGYPGNTAPSGYCWAIDSTGKSRSCTAVSDAQTRTIAAMNSTSYVSFYWDSNGNCTYIGVSNSSRWY